MIEQSRPILEYSALLFFNIFCLLGIIAIIAIILAVMTTRSGIVKTLRNLDERSEALTSKALDTMETAQEAAFTVAESGFNLFEVFSFLRGLISMRKPKRRKKTMQSLFESLFQNEK